MKRTGDPLTLWVLLGLLLLWYGALVIWDGRDPAGQAVERRAAATMARALDVLAREAERRGIPRDPALDPAGTGLVGAAWTPLTTTLGSLGAKRTGLQPDAAALMARLLRDAGLQPGGRVAVDSSSSFPGFAVAALVAAEACGAEVTCIVSLGSSTYGANRPEFTLPDMLAVLRREGLLRTSILAVSPGGADDLGRDMESALMEAALVRAGAPVLREGDPVRNVQARWALHRKDRCPDVLVSVGGNLSAAGIGEPLGMRNGVLRPRDWPDGPPGQGLIQTALRAGIPAIRILDVQALCAHTGLAYDPVTRQESGRSGLFRRPALPRPVLVAVPLLILGLAVGLNHRWRRAEPRA